MLRSRSFLTWRFDFFTFTAFLLWRFRLFIFHLHSIFAVKVSIFYLVFDFFTSVVFFTMNNRILFTFTVFFCEVSCVKSWSHENCLVSHEPKSDLQCIIVFVHVWLINVYSFGSWYLKVKISPMTKTTTYCKS